MVPHRAWTGFQMAVIQQSLGKVLPSNVKHEFLPDGVSAA
jgi:hypothetical protein